MLQLSLHLTISFTFNNVKILFLLMGSRQALHRFHSNKLQNRANSFRSHYKNLIYVYDDSILMPLFLLKEIYLPVKA